MFTWLDARLAQVGVWVGDSLSKVLCVMLAVVVIGSLLGMLALLGALALFPPEWHTYATCDRG